MISCFSKKTEKEDKTEVIPLNLSTHNQNMSEAIKDITLIPLETNDDCLIKSYTKIDFYPQINRYLILDSNLNVLLFSETGKFVSSSKDLMGEGPEEYLTIVDALYNPYFDCIELLTPYGLIYRYDLSFHFIEKISLDQTDIVFNRFFCYEEDKYVMTTSSFNELSEHVCLFDYKNKELIKAISYEKDFITSSVNMNFNPFFFVEKNIVFSPLGLDYNFYALDVDEQTLEPMITLNLKKENISKDFIVRKFGRKSRSRERKSIENNMEIERSLFDYLINSTYPLPLIKILNESYLYCHFLKNKERINMLYDKKKNVSYFQDKSSPFKLHFSLILNENKLIAFSQPFDVEKYISNELLDEKSKIVINTINEDDNPIIIVYNLNMNDQHEANH